MLKQSHDYIKPFQNINIPDIPKSVFALDYFVQGSCPQGTLVPIFKELIVPGDEITIGLQSVVRLLPMVAPAMTEINVNFNFFYVPLRILWDNTKSDRWSAFINMSAPTDAQPVIPRWNTGSDGTGYPDTKPGSLWDYFGFPVNIEGDKLNEDDFPTDFLRRAYNMVYNEYYRDQNLIPEVELTNDKVLRRAWKKDYFTSALPSPQAGKPPALPISGILPINLRTNVYCKNGKPNCPRPGDTKKVGELAFRRMFGNDEIINGETRAGTLTPAFAPETIPPMEDWYAAGMGQPYVDLAEGITFTISEFNLAYKIQRWLELNNRGGRRYTEYLRAHWNVTASDARLQRPEYIGGAKGNIIISEVLQTSESNGTALGSMGGHGLTVTDNFIGTYESEEWGVIIGLMSIMPTAVYSQGMPRKWTQTSPFDFYEPIFANLSEQPILNRELFLSNDKEYNKQIFGYQGRWDEYRTNQNQVCGELRSTLSYWTQQRLFTNDSKPRLNADFINCKPKQTIFADSSEDAHNFIYTVQNLVKAKRPMPAMSDGTLLTR